MAGTFPTTPTGKVSFKAGTELTHGRKTMVKRAINFAEQRWKRSQPLLSGTLSGTSLSAYTIGLWKEFFDAQKGEADATWSLAIEDPPGTTVTYPSMAFTQDEFTKTEVFPGKFNCTLSVRQIKKI